MSDVVDSFAMGYRQGAFDEAASGVSQPPMAPPGQSPTRLAGLKRLTKAVLPDPLLRHLAALLALSPAARCAYVRRRFRHQPREGNAAGRQPPSSLLFVCHGNIIRSAMAEQLLRRELAASGMPPLEVRSAGVHARQGRPADARAITVAEEFGVSLREHRATALSSTIVAESDLIIVMDYLNEAELIARFPAAADKVVLIGELLEPGEGDLSAEVPDPYSHDMAAIRASFARIERSIRALVTLAWRRA